jgi:hypothetical protein
MLTSSMPDPTAFETLLTQYRTLCRYCDQVFAATAEALRPHIRCAKGCAACCTLESVVPLEAHVIAAYLDAHPIEPSPAPPVARPDNEDAPCVFLRQQACTIYPARPIICRTHGLPLRYPDQPGIDACPLNFTDFDLSALDPQFVLDMGRITDNLIRLNLAFAVLTGQSETAGERVALQRLIP